jgi:uncharacterized protein (DUF1015 family)
MPELRPFRGIRYRPRAGDLADLVAPPYDVIDPGTHAALCRRSPYNVVRLILGERPSPTEAPPPDWYDAAARQLAAWLGQGILAPDPQPAFYLYTEAFDHDGRRLRRKLLLGALRLEPYGNGRVLPHENTLPGPKADRLRLMEACHANLSPILAFFPDHGGGIDALLETWLAADPDVGFTDDDGIQHELRGIAYPDQQAALREAVAPRALYIADGHHRYETSLAYRRVQRAALADPQDDLPCDYTLAACMSVADPAMVIRASHRIVHWDEAPDVGELLRLAERWFVVRRPAGANLRSLLAALATRGEAPTFAVYQGAQAGYALLELRDDAAMDGSPYPPGSPVRRLPAAALRHGFLEKLVPGPGAKVTYTPDPQAAVREVDEGRARLAGLLPGVRPDELMAVVDAGERMPPKSTYFWPKPKTGLVIRLLQEISEKSGPGVDFC